MNHALQLQKKELIQKEKENISQVVKKSRKYKINFGEFWTAKQRQMHPIHYTVSYRASFKPELPDYFIRKYCRNKDSLILDPFGGRGTTVMQANVLGYSGIHNDANPVSIFLSQSRQHIPLLDELVECVEKMDLNRENFILSDVEKERLLPFFHPDTLQEILNLRQIIFSAEGRQCNKIRYVGVTALSRLYGHSDGFFSVYTFPQISIMPGAQRRNNNLRGVRPEYKNVKERIIRKMKRDLSKTVPENYHNVSKNNLYLNEDARNISGAKTESVDLVVTSPPFLDKVNYTDDNWMRAWFLDLEKQMYASDVTMMPDLNRWSLFMSQVMRELGRILKKGGRAVIEVGEVKRSGKQENLEDFLIRHLPMDVHGGVLRVDEVFINQQEFTKLSNCWDVKNNELGTNTNRCLVIIKK